MPDDIARFAYLGLLLLAVGGFVLVEFRTNAGAATRGILAWVLIFAGLIAGVGLWDDIRSAVLPRQQTLPGGRVEVPIGPDGHFHLTAAIDGTPVRFVVDTGASTLTLQERDAERVGIIPDRLAYAGQARTANGIVATATVHLDSVRIGEIEDRDVAATVIRGDMNTSLMGMDYLRRFARVGFQGDMLVLER